MTVQKNQIQALIAEIDDMLGKASPRLPWVVSSEVTEQRQLLERIRGYLLAQAAGRDGSRPGLTYPNGPAPLGSDSDSSAGGGIQQEATRQIMQAVMQEMGYLRASITQPLQQDVELLQRQRDALTQEIQQLEAQRQSYQFQGHSPQINEFVQVLMGKVQEQLAQQMVHPGLSPSSSPGLPGAEPIDAMAGSPDPVGMLSPAQRLAQLESLQARYDQLVVSLDSTLTVVFEALQRNVQSYQESLSQGLDKMHTLGNQGEALFTTLVSHLAQQLGREAASTYLQAAAPSISLESSLSPSAQIAPASSSLKASQPIAKAEASPAMGLPFPGIELPPPPTTVIQGNDLSSFRDLDLEDLDLSNLDLSEPDFAVGDLPVVEGLNDLAITSLAFSDGEEEDSTVMMAGERGEPPVSLHHLVSPEAAPETEEPDSALEFLEQLSAALPDPPMTGMMETELEPDTTEMEPAEEESESGPEVDRALMELDDFYATLFGSPDQPASEASVSSVPPVEGPGDPAMAPPGEPEGGFAALEPITMLPDLEDVGERTDGEALSPGVDETEAPATLENFLFGDVPPEGAPIAAEEEIPPTDLPEDSIAPSKRSETDLESEEEPQNSETLALLSDLLAEVEEETDPASLGVEGNRPFEIAHPPGSAPAPGNALSPEPSLDELEDLTREEGYIPAAPDESLLANDLPAGTADIDLSLDRVTLMQLSQDLSSLEGLEGGDLQSLADEFGRSEAPSGPSVVAEVPTEIPTREWKPPTLEDFGTEVDAPPTSEPEPVPSPTPAETIGAVEIEITDLTLDKLDALFGDLPDADSASPDEDAPAIEPSASTSTHETNVILEALFPEEVLQAVPRLQSSPIEPSSPDPIVPGEPDYAALDALFDEAEAPPLPPAAPSEGMTLGDFFSGDTAPLEEAQGAVPPPSFTDLTLDSFFGEEPEETPPAIPPSEVVPGKGGFEALPLAVAPSDLQTPPDSTESVGTLDDLFTDLPVVESISQVSNGEPSPPSPSLEATLEDIFASLTESSFREGPPSGEEPKKKL